MHLEYLLDMILHRAAEGKTFALAQSLSEFLPTLQAWPGLPWEAQNPQYPKWCTALTTK